MKNMPVKETIILQLQMLTVTDVTNVAKTRKVTAFVAEDKYIEQGESWNNGTPNAYSVCVFNTDAIMHIWGNNKGTINNIRFETLAIRGCRAKVMCRIIFAPQINPLCSIQPRGSKSVFLMMRPIRIPY